MALYIKLVGQQSALQLTSNDQHGGPQVLVPNDGVYHLIPDELAQLPGVAEMLADGRLLLSSDISGTPNLTTVPASSTGGTNEVLINPTITNYTETKYVGGNTGTAKTIDLANGTVQAFTLTGNCTFTMPAQPGAGQSKSFSVPLNTGAGGFTAAFTGVKWPANAAPVATSTAARLDIFNFIADGVNWYGSVVQNYTP